MCVVFAVHTEKKNPIALSCSALSFISSEKLEYYSIRCLFRNGFSTTNWYWMSRDRHKIHISSVVSGWPFIRVRSLRLKHNQSLSQHALCWLNALMMETFIRNHASCIRWTKLPRERKKKNNKNHTHNLTNDIPNLLKIVWSVRHVFEISDDSVCLRSAVSYVLTWYGVETANRAILVSSSFAVAAMNSRTCTTLVSCACTHRFGFVF